MKLNRNTRRAPFCIGRSNEILKYMWCKINIGLIKGRKELKRYLQNMWVLLLGAHKIERNYTDTWFWSNTNCLISTVHLSLSLSLMQDSVNLIANEKDRWALDGKNQIKRWKWVIKGIKCYCNNWMNCCISSMFWNLFYR